ncbi:MAG: serine hydrolase [Acidobacteria bacterium]|nr:serine hydrolase [Acidobacteriota bacterium]
MFRKTILVFIAAFCAISVAAQNADDRTKVLDAKIKNAIEGFKGDVWVYAKNLDTGKDYALRADEQVRTASTIKLPIMAEVFRQVEAGKIKWDHKLTIPTFDPGGGSGVLKEFSSGLQIDLRTAVILMNVVSDNLATNLIIETVTADAVNKFMAELGLKDTLSMRKVGGYESGGLSTALKEDDGLRRFGLGRSSPRDMVKLLELLENGKVVSKEASAEMINILKRQQYKTGIGRNAASGVQVASKSGGLDLLKSDVGILYTPGGRIAMAITVDNMEKPLYIQDHPGQLLIWKLSEILQSELAK